MTMGWMNEMKWNDWKHYMMCIRDTTRVTMNMSSCSVAIVFLNNVFLYFLHQHHPKCKSCRVMLSVHVRVRPVHPTMDAFIDDNPSTARHSSNHPISHYKDKDKDNHHMTWLASNSWSYHSRISTCIHRTSLYPRSTYSSIRYHTSWARQLLCCTVL